MILVSMSDIFCIIICFSFFCLTKLLTSDVLFSTAFNAEVVAKPLTLCLNRQEQVLICLHLFYLLSAFNLAKIDFDSNLDVSTPFIFLKSAFVA